jgi:hypothetical protein
VGRGRVLKAHQRALSFFVEKAYVQSVHSCACPELVEDLERQRRDDVNISIGSFLECTQFCSFCCGQALLGFFVDQIKPPPV